MKTDRNDDPGFSDLGHFDPKTHDNPDDHEKLMDCGCLWWCCPHCQHGRIRNACMHCEDPFTELNDWISSTEHMNMEDT